MFIAPLSKVHRTFFSYKAKVAIEAIKEQKTISEIAVEYKVSPSLISAWKAEFLENASQAFMKTGNQSREVDKLKHENEKLLKKVEQLTLEVDFFALKYPLEISVMREEWNTEEKMKRGRNLPAGISLNRYCKLIGLTRSNCYYEKVGESAENINLMNIIDRFWTEHPTAGARTIRYHLCALGYNVNLKRIRRLMSVMGIESIYPKKSLSKVGKTQYIHPYLLRDLVIDHANQVWSTDISYIPMPNGFMYLYAMIDVHSRYLLGWRLSNTLTEDNCLELMKECVSKHGVPEIVNTDQGSHYTSPRWVDLLQEYGVKVSMDGRGRCKDSIWIERFWRTKKQEVIYINPTDSVTEPRTLISDFIEYYNTQRPHQSLGGIAPTKIYFSLAARYVKTFV